MELTKIAFRRKSRRNSSYQISVSGLVVEVVEVALQVPKGSHLLIFTKGGCSRRITWKWGVCGGLKFESDFTDNGCNVGIVED